MPQVLLENLSLYFDSLKKLRLITLNYSLKEIFKLVILNELNSRFTSQENFNADFKKLKILS